MPKTNKSKGMGVMDAVTALTTLGDEEEYGSESGEKQSPEKQNDSDKRGSDEEEEAKADDGTDEASKPRYIPEHKKPDAALTFPEKLMNMMRYVDEFRDDDKYPIAWIPDGKSFVVRNPSDFTRNVLPKYFKATKFQSFTRKLYRWGFRQVNRGIGPDDPIIFGNEYFQRDDEELMVKMRSVTAASNRRSGGSASGRKRSLEELDEQRKMILFDRLMQEKAAMGDPRVMAQYAAMGGFRFPPGAGFPPGMTPMMMGRFGPGGMPGMFNMQQPNQEGGEGEAKAEGGEGGDGEEAKAEGGEGGDGEAKPPTPQQPQTEQQIMDSAVAALRYSA